MNHLRIVSRRLYPIRHTFRPMVTVTQTKTSELPTKQEKIMNVDLSKFAGEEIPQFEDIAITESCWKRIHALAQRQKLSLDSSFLRLYVDAGGCSGFEYKFELDDSIEDDDKVYNGPGGARVVVDESSLDLLKGSTIDYVQEMIKSSFEVKDNPQSESACGCGSSFALKNFEANPALD